MPVQKGTLKPGDDRRIQQNYTFLLKELDGKYLAARMFENNVFTQDDKEEINSFSTRGKRTESFLDKLLHSGSGKAYDTFLQVLKAEGYDFVVDKLDETDITEESKNLDITSWLASLSDEIKAHVPTDADASRLAPCLMQVYQPIFIRLGVPKVTIDQEIYHYRDSITDLITNLIIKWRQRFVKQATMRALIDAMIEIENHASGSINWEQLQSVLDKLQIDKK